jgi:hypothetical protein
MKPIVNIFFHFPLHSYCYRQMGRRHLCIRDAYDTFRSRKLYDPENEEEEEDRGCEPIFPKEAPAMWVILSFLLFLIMGFRLVWIFRIARRNWMSINIGV